MSGPPPDAGASPVKGLAHIAIATPDADALARTFVAALGATLGAEELIDGGTLRIVFVHVGPVTFELLEPRSGEHTVAKFLEKRGAGLHHVNFEVGDVAAVLERARIAGLQLIDEAPRQGAHGSRVAFLHPRSFGGVLIEVCEPDPPVARE